MTFTTVWHRFWFTPRPAEDLAICRILFAAGMFLVGLSRPIHEWGEVPAFYLRPGVFLRRLDIPILDTGVLQGMEFVWLGAIVTLALGWYSRTSAAIVCLFSFYLFGIDAPEFLGRSVTAGVFVPAILAVSVLRRCAVRRCVASTAARAGDQPAGRRVRLAGPARVRVPVVRVLRRRRGEDPRDRLS